MQLKMKWLCDNFKKILFSLISLFSFFLAVVFSFDNEDVLPGIWLTFSLFTLMLGWPEIADSITFLGNSIKLRELKASLKDVRSVIEANTRAIFEMVQTQMRFGGVSDEQKDSIYKNLTEVLEKADFSKKEIEDIQSRWHYWILGDYVRGILFTRNMYHPNVNENKKEEWVKKAKELKEKIDDVTPDQLRQLFIELDCYNDEAKELIDDYEYYIKNKSHRRPESWKNREHWFKNI